MTISSQDGLELHVKHWPVENVKRVVCIIHGLGEHSGRYDHFAKALNKSGSAVFALDCRGHGLSKGKKGHSSKYYLLLSDIEELIKTARSEYTDSPIVLLGHSMGGNLVASYALTMNINEISGFILSAPWLKLAFDAPKWKVKMGRFLSNVIPSIQLSSELEQGLLSKDEAEIAKYANDPLVHSKLTPGLYFQIEKAGLESIDSDKRLSKPIFCYHGTKDGITSAHATEAFAKKMENGSWWSIENGYHEPHNDEERETVFDKINTWIESEIPT